MFRIMMVMDVMDACEVRVDATAEGLPKFASQLTRARGLAFCRGG